MTRMLSVAGTCGSAATKDATEPKTWMTQRAAVSVGDTQNFGSVTSRATATKRRLSCSRVASEARVTEIKRSLSKIVANTCARWPSESTGSLAICGFTGSNAVPSPPASGLAAASQDKAST